MTKRTLAQPASPLAAPSPWLRLARWVLLALVAASTLAVVASLVLAPSYVPRHIDNFPLSEAWPPELIQAALAELGWPPSTVAWYEFIRSFGLYLGTLLPGLLILQRKSHDWFGLYMAFALIVVPAFYVVQPITGLLPGLSLVSHLAGALAWQLFFVMFYVFPDGHFVPRWTRWLLPLWVSMNLIPGAYGEGIWNRLPWLVFIPFGLVFIAIGSQIYRYFWRANATQRQQTKWVVAALALAMVCLGWLGPSIQRPAPDRALGATLVLELGRLAVVNLGFVVISVAIAIAMLRYRLWDIDVIIRRTLIYSALTGLLALAYLGSVLILQPLLARVSGQGSALATVLSTLLIAALFLPVRVRVQRAIDRRFYRRKYDAARTLAAFGEHARDETDLGRLSERLTGAVQETMQPAHVSLWLRAGPDGGRARSEN